MILLNGIEVEFKTFPNGETLMRTEGIEELDAGLNMVSFKYHHDGDLIKLMFLKKYLDNLDMHAHLVIYYMPYSRMDRSENGSAFTLKYVSEFINNLEFERVEIIEPHSDVTPALINRATTTMINYDLLPEVMKEVNFNEKEDYLFFPDAGAQKRYSGLDNYNFNTLVGYKKRDFETGRITDFKLVGEYNGVGKRAIIIDDLSSYGGTFMLAGEHLKQAGFEEVYLLVAHAEDNIFKGKIFEEGSPITKVFTTDTILSTPLVWTNKQHENKITIFNVKDFV